MNEWKWTNERPSVPGEYWRKGFKSVGICRVEQAQVDDQRLLLDAEWCGPIPIPSDEADKHVTTINETIPDEMYHGKVKEVFESGTYFAKSVSRIKELEKALLWCSGAKCFREDAENEFINTVQPLLKSNWF